MTRRVVVSIACLLVWASRTVLPGDIRYGPLEGSWAEGLGYALEHGWQFGRDVVFTFGPLGCFSTAISSPGLFWIKVLAWEGAFQLLVAAVVTSALFRIENRWLRALAFLMVVFQPLNPDAYAFLAIASALVVLVEARRTAAVVASAAVLAGLSLVKFSFALAGLPCAALAAASLVRSGSRRLGWTLAGAYPAFLLLVWLACGQSIAGILDYVASSLRIAGAYGEAMSQAAPPWTVPIAVLLILAALADAGLGGPRLAALAYAALLWIAYKAGFVRAQDHTPIFFQFAAVAPLLFGGEPQRRSSIAARLLCAALGVAGLCAASAGAPKAVTVVRPGVFGRVAEHAAALFRPRASPPDSEDWTNLPRTREVVGEAGIDMMSYLQVLLFRNQLRWTPRPVFQGYACLTPELAEENARFLEDDRAPEVVLFLLQSIDDRLMTMDDAPALRVLARDYEPVLQEKSFLLCRRRPGRGSHGPAGVELRADAAFGEWIDLRGIRGACHLLRLDVRKTLAGRAFDLLDAAPRLDLELELEDGQTIVARIVPGMMRTGVIVDPVLRGPKDWFAWRTGEPVQRAVGLRVRRPKLSWAYEPRFEVEILRDDSIVPSPRPGLGRDLLYSIFPSRPDEVASARPPSRGLLGDDEVLRLSPTSRLSFAVAAGARRLRASFGWSSADPPGFPLQDAVFRAVLEQPGREDRTLFERRLDPAHEIGDRELQSLDLRFDSDAPGTLVLSSSSGATTSGHDCAAWAMIRLE